MNPSVYPHYIQSVACKTYHGKPLTRLAPCVALAGEARAGAEVPDAVSGPLPGPGRRLQAQVSRHKPQDKSGVCTSLTVSSPCGVQSIWLSSGLHPYFFSGMRTRATPTSATHAWTTRLAKKRRSANVSVHAHLYPPNIECSFSAAYTIPTRHVTLLRCPGDKLLNNSRIVGGPFRPTGRKLSEIDSHNAQVSAGLQGSSNL